MKFNLTKLNQYCRISLGLTAPYWSVLLFWNLLENAWLTILGYHLLILIAQPPKIRFKRGTTVKSGWNGKLFAGLIPWFAVTGLIVYYMIPVIGKQEIGVWLSRYNLNGGWFIIMIPYFGIVHPILEQVNWAELSRSRVNQWIIDVAFSGYHLIVLWGLIKSGWLVIIGIILIAASRIWYYLRKKTGDKILLNIIFHIAADLGIIIAAGLRS